MNHNRILSENIDVLQRRLTGLKDTINKRELSKGQAKFIKVYLDVISEYTDKGLDIFDENKYREALIELEI